MNVISIFIFNENNEYYMCPTLDDCRYGVFKQFVEGQLDCHCPERCWYDIILVGYCFNLRFYFLSSGHIGLY